MQAEHFFFDENGWVPNNAALPVLVYHGVLTGSSEEAAEAFERLFARHGWPPQWRDTVYDYHHYHSTAHEVLGVAAGSATLENWWSRGAQATGKGWRCFGPAGRHGAPPHRAKQ